MLKIYNDAGRAFLVRVVCEGDRYGPNDALTYPHNEYEARAVARGDVLVEFYDAGQDLDRFGPRYQYVARYYLSALVAHTRVGGRGGYMSSLTLMGHVPAWYVSGTNVREAVAYAQGVVEERRKK